MPFEEFARTLHFALRVPGAHPSGPAYDTLLGYLAAQGRPFAADSSKLRDHVAHVLIEQFGDAKRAPGAAQLRQFAAAAILEWVLARLESEGTASEVSGPAGSTDASLNAKKDA